MAMKVKEAELDLAKRLKERIGFSPAVTNAVRKQYLESARGHYLSALAGLNAGKQETTNICHAVDALSVLDDNALEQAAEAEEMPRPGQLGQAKTFAGMDVQIHFPKGVLKESDRRLQGKMARFNKTLQKNTNEKIAEIISRIGDSGQDLETLDASEPEDSTTVLPELIGVNESALKGLIEGRSLQRMVKSLKVELENLKKEHAELKDKGAGAETVTRKLHFKLHKSKPELEDSLVHEPAVRHSSELIASDQHEAEDWKIEGKALKRENENSKFSEEGVKRHRVAPTSDKARDAMMSAYDQTKCMPGKIYDACVSTSESSARIMFSEDELESSSQKAGKSDRLQRNKFTVVKGRVDSAKYDHSSEFSIRDYVFAARNKDISINWPFSQKNLQLCLKHGVKDVLPPFQSMDSLGDSSMKRCLTNTSLHSEESKLDERPLVQIRHVVPGTTINHRWNPELAEGYRDSDLFPSMGEKELAFKSTVMANSQSEVESVSTSNLPLSEVSDEQVAAASASASASGSAVKNMKCSASQPSSKKCKVAFKVHFSGSRGATDDITSACTTPSETMASKICPVCETFSSSSNTTLNAHIDQCLSSHSTPNWMKNSKLVKPRIRPRKMRSMVDICATAPHCTLEDLDRRNGTNWATNAEFPPQDTEIITQGKSCGVLARHVNNGDNGAVYIDSSGRKIRILSKFNDISSSSLSFPKAKEDLRSKKQSKPDKTNKFFSSKRKRRLGKHLKYLKVNNQRKRLSYHKIKGRLNEACGAAEATSSWGEKHVKEQRPGLFVKAQGRKNASGSGTLKLWISSKRSNLSKKNDSEGINKPCRQASNDLQPGSDHLDSEMLVKKPSNSPEKSLPFLRSGVRTRLSCQSGTDQKSESSSGSKTFCSSSMEVATRGGREPCLVPMELGAVQYDGKERVSKPVDSAVSLSSSLERDDEIQADAVGNADSSFLERRKFSDGSHVVLFEGSRSNNTEMNMRTKSVMYVHAGQSNSEQKSSALEKSSGCRNNVKGDAQSVDIRSDSDAIPDYPNLCKITNSLGRTMKLRRKREFVHGQDGSTDTKGTCGLSDESQDNHGCETSVVIRLRHNREVSVPISSPGIVNEEAVMDSTRSVDPESQNVIDVPDPLLKSVQYLDPLHNPSGPSLSDDNEIFHGNVVGTERLETGVSDFNVGLASSFPEVDPIPIPGPPGSDLPSFSDMGSEDLHRSSSLNSSLAQTSGDGDDDVDGNLSDSLLSATSTVSNLGVTEDPNVSIPECFLGTLPGSNNVYPGWLGTSVGHMMGAPEIFSKLDVTGRERAPAQVENSEDNLIARGRGHPVPEGCNQQCSSWKEGIPWNAALNFEESQLLGQRMETLVALPSGMQMASTLHGRTNCLDGRNTMLSLRSFPRGESENLSRFSETSCESIMAMDVTTGAAVSFPRAGGCDSANPGPILRLMGKDLMVINKAKDDISTVEAVQNVCTNRQVLPVSEFHNGFPRSWQHQPPQGMSFMGPPLHEQVPDTVSMQHFEVGPSDMINTSRCPKQLSQVSMYFDKNLHANFSVLGAAPLQR